MRSLGDKISSTIVAQHAKVPCMAWSGTGITDTQMSAEGFVEVPEDAYLKACVRSASEGLERANTIGYPVMIKASEGGGGKGIRKVESEQAFAQAFKAVESEVPGEGGQPAAVAADTDQESYHADVCRMYVQALPSSL